MAQTIDPILRAYLQARIKAWLAVPDRTARELARLAGVSGAQISEAVSAGAIGWKTMTGLLPIFGLTLGSLEEEARRWAAQRRPSDVPPAPRRRGQPRLGDRPEWPAVSTAVRDEHGELDEEDVVAVGRIADDAAVFAGPLDAPTVAGLAAVLGARRTRLARRRADQA